MMILSRDMKASWPILGRVSQEFKLLRMKLKADKRFLKKSLSY